MGKHESYGQSDEWYTPKYIFDALGCLFDMDVAAPVDRQFCHVPALQFITDNSLIKEWIGFIWMNPPYGHQRDKLLWLNKFIDHKNGIGLMPDRTSAEWWQHTSKNTDAVLFVDGKIKFIKPDGTTGDQPGNGTTLFSIGSKGIKALENAEGNGLGRMYVNKDYVTNIVVVGISPSWLSVVRIAVNHFGDNELKPVYDMVEQIAPDKVIRNPFWREKVRQKIQLIRNRKVA